MTQNDFIYGELGRTVYYTSIIYIIIRYWLKVILAEEQEYIKKIYNVMLTDINDIPNIQNWASLVRNTFSNLGFLNVWIAQGMGDENIFLSVIKQRFSGTFEQREIERIK